MSQDPTGVPSTAVLDPMRLVAVGLAEIRQEPLYDLLASMEEDPDLFAIDSKESEAILAHLEGDFGCKLVTPSDLKPEIMGSLRAVLLIVGRRPKTAT